MYIINSGKVRTRRKQYKDYRELHDINDHEKVDAYCWRNLLRPRSMYIETHGKPATDLR